jgi:hypothetical protein
MKEKKPRQSVAGQEREKWAPNIRGESNLVEKTAAIKLVLASRDYSGNQTRCLDMIDWILTGEEPKPGNEAHRSVALFVEAIGVTKK